MACLRFGWHGWQVTHPYMSYSICLDHPFDIHLEVAVTPWHSVLISAGVSQTGEGQGLCRIGWVEWQGVRTSLPTLDEPPLLQVMVAVTVCVQYMDRTCHLAIYRSWLVCGIPGMDDITTDKQISCW
jgi:hypothetical protein